MRAEDMFMHYRNMRQELAMVTYDISHFTGISQEDVIEMLTFMRNDEIDRRDNHIPRRTELIAIAYRDITDRENREWYNYLVERWKYLDDEISFFEFCITQMGEKNLTLYTKCWMGILLGTT